MINLIDFPKLKSPFVRKMVNNNYVVTNEINEECKWFQDDDVICTEKLHGTCCAAVIENGVVIALFNRTNRIPFIGGTLSKALTEGVNNALIKKRFVLQDGILWGELIGPKIQKNEYDLKEHEWIPFSTYCQKNLKYKCWGKYPKTFESMSEWFKELMPLYMLKKGVKDGFVEGVVFVKISTGQMCKLRIDMFDWHKGERHKKGDKNDK